MIMYKGNHTDVLSVEMLTLETPRPAASSASQ